MAQIRAIRKRMTAVGTIARITKTMQMIATAKFTAALARAKDSRPYTDAIRNLVGEVSGAAGDYDSPLFKPSQTQAKNYYLSLHLTEGCVVRTTETFLKKQCNTFVQRKVKTSQEIELETSGKKAVSFFKFQKTDTR